MRITFRNPRLFSSPSVRSFGVVVRVISEEPIIRNTSLTAIAAAIYMPSLVTLIFHIWKSTSPSVRNMLKITLNISSINTAFRPLKINLTGTFEALMHANRNKPAIVYISIFCPKKREIMYISVQNNLTRGSSLWIIELDG